MDLYSLKEVGWAMIARMKIALAKGLYRCPTYGLSDKKGLVDQLDHGRQHASQEYQEMPESPGMICSVSR